MMDQGTPYRPHTLVIGGTRGIGRALVETLVAGGHFVSVVGRRPVSEMPPVRPNVSCWSVDLADIEKLHTSLSEIVSRDGKVNHIVFFQRYRGSGDAWSEELQTSLTATAKTIEFLAGHFGVHSDNSIVLVSSIAASFVAIEQPVGYHVTKAGIVQMARYFAVVLGPRGIRVNSVSPGTVLKEESMEFYLKNKELLDLYRTITPLGRMGTAEEISGVIEFLCSRKASLVTGQNLVLDGGISLQSHESLCRRVANLVHPNTLKQDANRI